MQRFIAILAGIMIGMSGGMAHAGDDDPPFSTMTVPAEQFPGGPSGPVEINSSTQPVWVSRDGKERAKIKHEQDAATLTMLQKEELQHGTGPAGTTDGLNNLAREWQHRRLSVAQSVPGAPAAALMHAKPAIKWVSIHLQPGLLSAQTQEWLQSQNWHVVWQSSSDWNVPVGYTLGARDVDGVMEQLAQSYGFSVRVYKDNRTVVILNRAGG